MAMHAGIRVPQISRDELFAFHESHFSHISVADFGSKFTSLPAPIGDANTDRNGVDQEGELPLEEEGDYDPETYDPEAYDLYDELPDIPAPFADNGWVDGGLDDGEIVEAQDEDRRGDKTDEPDDPNEQPRKKRRRKKNNMGNSNARRFDGTKPDLRKRTWDVVDTGLGSLDYDGLKQSASSVQAAPTRRRVQYDDD